TPAVVKDHHGCLPKPMDRVFVWKCSAMLGRTRSRSAAAMLAGRRCVRRHAVAACRAVGDGYWNLMVAPGNPGQASGSSRQPPALDGFAAYIMTGIGCWAMIKKSGATFE